MRQPVLSGQHTADQAGRQEDVKEGCFLARCGFIKELIYLGMWSLGD